MAFTFELKDLEITKEVYWVDFSIFKPITRKHKFYELQRLAFSKGIMWTGTGDHLELYSTMCGDMGETSVIIHITNGCWGKCLAYDKGGTQMDYKSAIKRLREL